MKEITHIEMKRSDLNELLAKIETLTRELAEARDEIAELKPLADAWRSCVGVATGIWEYGHGRGEEERLLAHIEFLLAELDAQRRTR